MDCCCVGTLCSVLFVFLVFFKGGRRIGLTAYFCALVDVTGSSTIGDNDSADTVVFISKGLNFLIFEKSVLSFFKDVIWRLYSGFTNYSPDKCCCTEKGLALSAA